jgi:hypothetical protein
MRTRFKGGKDVNPELSRIVRMSNGFYMPIYRAGTEVQQNSTRLKNLIRQAESSIVESGLSDKEAGEFLQPIQELVDSDESFWQESNNDGLAVFLTSGVFRYYRLPLIFDELVVVTDRFHLKPLLPLLRGDGKYYILALSQEEDVFCDQSRKYSGSIPKLQIAHRL